METHNLARQNFTNRDVGKNKARVLAERYGGAFNINIGFIPKYLNNEDIQDILSGMGGFAPVFVGCVDNNKTRALIHAMYRRSRSNGSVYIDSGNEEYAGQVVFSTNFGYTTNGYSLNFAPLSSTDAKRRIPDAVEHFDMKPDDRHPDELSCAERAVHAPQNIATNIMAAGVLFNYCNAILCASAQLTQVDINDIMALADAYKAARGISAHVTFFNAKTGATQTQEFPENISSYIEKYRTSRDWWVNAEKERLAELQSNATPEAQEEAVVTTVAEAAPLEEVILF